VKPRVQLCLFACFILILGFPSETAAQRTYRFFYGKVLDKETKRPLSNVNFTVRNSKVGTTSDSKGEFSFYLDTIPAILTVSHVGYSTKKIILDTSTYKMTLYLLPEAKMLREVVISAKKQETIFKDDHYAVLDFEIDSGAIYLLVYRNRFSKAELLCRTPGGDTLATSGLLPFSAKRLVKDCLGFLHVFSGDSVWQVFKRGSRIVLIHPVTTRKYDEVLEDCIASTQDLLYFKRTTNRGLGTEFYTIDRKTNFQRHISQVRDEKKAKMLRRNPEDAWMLMSPLQPDQNAGKLAETRADMDGSRNATVEWYWVRKIIYPPIKTFLYRIGEFICIFNTPNLQMEFYDLEGNYSYKIALKLYGSGEGRWTYDILIDAITLKVYTTYLKNGVLSLHEIDLNTGELSKAITVQHLFPQKLRVFDNYLYYLYDDPQTPDNKMLFRQRL
jgi:hypothetical protein